MLKYEFLGILQRELYNLPKNEIKEQLNFYSEMIDDGIEEGLSEEEAVAKIGSISEILSQINREGERTFEVPMAKKVQSKKQNESLKRKLGAGAITLIAIGSPIWISLLAAAVSVAVAFYAVIWSAFAAVCAVELSLAAIGVAGVFYPIIFIPQGAFLNSAFVFGGALVCLGLSVFLWYGCKKILFCILELTKFSFVKVKLLFERMRY